MICFPNCKINLGLNIVKKRSDGFHNIETVFYPVPLCDALEIIESKELSIEASGLSIEGDAMSNICIKAYNKIAAEYKIPGVKIILHKAIPSGAGLGGGSSDAAFMLKLLNDLFSLNISEEKLFQIATELGSDCAFFMKNKAAYAHGRGEKMQPIDLDLKGYHIVIVKPDFGISTARAYSLIHPKPSTYNLSGLSVQNISDWKNVLVNDFEEALFHDFPEIKNIKETLYHNGALYASMSGSGSAVYGIFDKEPATGTSLTKYFTWKGLLE